MVLEMPSKESVGPSPTGVESSECLHSPAAAFHLPVKLRVSLGKRLSLIIRSPKLTAWDGHQNLSSE